MTADENLKAIADRALLPLFDDLPLGGTPGRYDRTVLSVVAELRAWGNGKLEEAACQQDAEADEAEAIAADTKEDAWLDTAQECRERADAIRHLKEGD